MVELGIESRREAAPIPGQFPKLKTLHVWWARRPLAASAGAVLGSLMPAWSTELASAFQGVAELASEDSYQRWFLRLCGVLGDPVAARARIAAADEAGIKLGAKAYGYKQAFKNSPTISDLQLLHQVLDFCWQDPPVVCDPTAGGGSIPFEALRYAFPVHANDLNPVAASILRAAVELPATFGAGLSHDVRSWGTTLTERIQHRLLNAFQLPDNTSDNNTYIFARTVTCPRTGRLVPLSPNWWLRKGSKPVAVRLVAERGGRQLNHCEFEIVAGRAIDFDPDRGTVAGGDAVSPWDGLAIDGEHIKTEARAGRMGEQLYAVAIRTANGRGFRAPTKIDLDALDAAERNLEELLPLWIAKDVVPDEPIDSISNYDRGHRLYGINTWRQMFSPRQLLVHCTFVEEFRRLVPEVRSELGRQRGDAVLTLLALMKQGRQLERSPVNVERRQ